MRGGEGGERIRLILTQYTYHIPLYTKYHKELAFLGLHTENGSVLT